MKNCELLRFSQFSEILLVYLFLFISQDLLSCTDTMCHWTYRVQQCKILYTYVMTPTLHGYRYCMLVCFRFSLFRVGYSLLSFQFHTLSCSIIHVHVAYGKVMLWVLGLRIHLYIIQCILYMYTCNGKGWLWKNL